MMLLATSMEIDANVYHLLNVLLQVILWSLIISSPFIILTIEMYAYERYKKWKDTEAKEKEKIILGRANKIVAQDEELQRQNEEKKKLELEIDLLNIRKKSIQDEIGIPDDPEETEEDPEEVVTDLSQMTIRELKSLAKERGLKMYSKKNKEQLVKLLKG